MKKWIKEEDVMGVLGIAPPELLADHIADLDGVWMADEDVEEVALDHLKAVADKLGYDLVKKPVDLLPCPRCGCGETNLYRGIGTRIYVFYKCKHCGLTAKRASYTQDGARRYWNEMVEEYEKV